MCSAKSLELIPAVLNGCIFALICVADRYEPVLRKQNAGALSKNRPTTVKISCEFRAFGY
ncbi:MAG: hypothetical protein LBP79_03760 [Clostridiales bacterium]|nr:hypothetical protein [Clostridiales bacterium]